MARKLKRTRKQAASDERVRGVEVETRRLLVFASTHPFWTSTNLSLGFYEELATLDGAIAWVQAPHDAAEDKDRVYFPSCLLSGR